MKRILTILLFFLCNIVMNAQTNNVTRKQSQKQTSTQATSASTKKHSAQSTVSLTPEQMCARAKQCSGRGDNKGKYKWYKLAAEKGYANGLNGLGTCYRYGFGVERDRLYAIELFKQAAEKGFIESLWNIGGCYGDQKQYEEALIWYKKAAENGYALACESIGMYYFKGLGTKVNLEEGFKWFEKEAHLDDRRAYRLGECYEYGHGCAKDLEKAKYWYQKAKDAGDYTAKCALDRLSQ